LFIPVPKAIWLHFASSFNGESELFTPLPGTKKPGALEIQSLSEGIPGCKSRIVPISFRNQLIYIEPTSCAIPSGTRCTFAMQLAARVFEFFPTRYLSRRCSDLNVSARYRYLLAQPLIARDKQDSIHRSFTRRVRAILIPSNQLNYIYAALSGRPEIISSEA